MICLVTDRRRLVAAAAAPGAPRECLAAQVRYAVKAGEIARALVVCMELQADAGSYRDVAERIDRLTKVQAGS